jgi:hypothetical protein
MYRCGDRTCPMWRLIDHQRDRVLIRAYPPSMDGQARIGCVDVQGHRRRLRTSILGVQQADAVATLCVALCAPWAPWAVAVESSWSCSGTSLELSRFQSAWLGSVGDRPPQNTGTRKRIGENYLFCVNAPAPPARARLRAALRAVLAGPTLAPADDAPVPSPSMIRSPTDESRARSRRFAIEQARLLTRRPATSGLAATRGPGECDPDPPAVRK